MKTWKSAVSVYLMMTQGKQKCFLISDLKLAISDFVTQFSFTTCSIS